MIGTVRTCVVLTSLALFLLTVVGCTGPGSHSIVQAANSPVTLKPPQNVAVSNSPEGHVIVRWDKDPAPVHRVAWANAADVVEAQAAGDWRDALHFADTKRETDYTIKHLPAGQRYWFTVGAANKRFGNAVWSPWTSLTTSAPVTDPTVPAGKVKVLAPIESVQIVVAESWPPQYFVHVVSGLPNGCAEFHGYQETRSGNVITITVYNLEPAPSEQIACTMIYRTHEFSVPLGSDFEPGVLFSVRVNDVVEDFVAQGVSDSDDTQSVVEPAPIENVAIQVGAGANGEDYLVVEYALPNGCYEFYSYELIDQDGEFVVEILNFRRDRDDDGNPIACAEIYLTFEVRLLIATDVQIGQVYNVTVNGNTYAITATAAP